MLVPGSKDVLRGVVAIVLGTPRRAFPPPYSELPQATTGSVGRHAR